MHQGRQGEVEPVSGMMGRYPDQWIFFEVLERDENEYPSKGILIAHSPDRDEVHRIAMRTQVQEAAIFFTGDPVPEGAIVLL